LLPYSYQLHFKIEPQSYGILSEVSSKSGQKTTFRKLKMNCNSPLFRPGFDDKTATPCRRKQTKRWKSATTIINSLTLQNLQLKIIHFGF